MNQTRVVLSHGLGVVGAALVGLLALGCDGLLDVETPDIVRPEDLEQEPSLPVLHAGAIGDFARAVSSGVGAPNTYIIMTGLMTDEFVHSGTFPTRQEWDRRQVEISNPTAVGTFQNLHRARIAAEIAAERLEAAASDPAADARIGETLALAGYTYLLFAEGWCSGVPFSRVPETGPVEFGFGATTEEMLNLALQRFDAALDRTGGSDPIAGLATMGRARALLNQGQISEAGALAATVSTDFVYNIFHSGTTTRQWNHVWDMVNNVERWSVAHTYGINGLAFRTLDGDRSEVDTDPTSVFPHALPQDPRIPWALKTAIKGGTNNKGFDNLTVSYFQLKFPDRTASLPLSDGIEARLIEAEAALAAGQIATWLGLLNDLRSVHPELDAQPLTDPGTQAAREDLHFKERAFWLYARGNRIGDLRRLIRQYGRDSESVFPTGSYFKGGSFGPDVNFPVPIEEENNPNFVECFDRNA